MAFLHRILALAIVLFHPIFVLSTDLCVGPSGSTCYTEAGLCCGDIPTNLCCWYEPLGDVLNAIDLPGGTKVQAYAPGSDTCTNYLGECNLQDSVTYSCCIDFTDINSANYFYSSNPKRSEPEFDAADSDGFVLPNMVYWFADGERRYAKVPEGQHKFAGEALNSGNFTELFASWEPYEHSS